MERWARTTAIKRREGLTDRSMTVAAQNPGYRQPMEPACRLQVGRLTSACPTLMQNAVDLRAVFLDKAHPDPRNCEQFPRCTGTLARDGSQCLVAQDAECRRPPSSGFSETPGAQRFFQAGI